MPSVEVHAARTPAPGSSHPYDEKPHVATTPPAAYYPPPPPPRSHTGDSAGTTYTASKPPAVWRTLVRTPPHPPRVSIANHTQCYLTFLLPFTSLYLLLSSTVQCSFRGQSALSAALLWHHRFLPATAPVLRDDSAVRVWVLLLFGPLVGVGVALAAAGVSAVWFYTDVLLGEKNSPGGVEWRAFEWVVRLWDGWVKIAGERGEVEMV